MSNCHLKFSCSFDNKRDISETRNNAKRQEDQCEPRWCIKFAVQHDPNPKADENSKWDGKAKTAVVGQLFKRTSGFSFHGRVWNQFYVKGQ